MVISISYEQWVEKFKNSTDFFVSHRELNGFRDEDEEETFLYPHLLVDDLSHLPYEGTVKNVLYYLMRDEEDKNHYERLYVDVEVDAVSVSFSITFNHLSHTITRYYRPELFNFGEEGTVWVSLKNRLYQQIEDFMREHSPDRLSMLTHTYSIYESKP